VPGFNPTPPAVGMPAGFTAVPVVFGGTKGGVPTFGLLTTEVTGEVGEVFFGSPVILSMTAFVAAPKAAPVKAVPNLLVVPVDFVTTGFVDGVTVVLVAGVVGVLAIAGFVVAAVVLDVSEGFVETAGLAVLVTGLAVVLAVVTGFVAVVLDAKGDLAAAVLEVIEGLAIVAAGFIPMGFAVTPARAPPKLVRGANALEVVDVIGLAVIPPRDGCLPPPIDG